LSVRPSDYAHVDVPPPILEKMKKLGNDRYDLFRKRNYRVDSTRLDGSLNLDGVRSEWCLGEYTEGRWNPKNQVGNDGGLDVQFEAQLYGERVLIWSQIKCLGRRLPGGDPTQLLLYVNDPDREIVGAHRDVRVFILATLCVCNVLITRDDGALAVDLIGWVTREHFLAAGRWTTRPGHGARFAVSQEELSPMRRLQPWRHDPPPWPFVKEDPDG
jgi:hypothetical protein